MVDFKDVSKFLSGFSILLVVLVMLYVTAVTFLPMPPTGAKYADMAVPLLLGSVIGAVVGYFYGSSNDLKKSPTSSTPETPSGQ